jgi:predicted unusual protein kinase regulating ubiquinone biosynthesis (AarF/ABC1/UbiB family)
LLPARFLFRTPRYLWAASTFLLFGIPFSLFLPWGDIFVRQRAAQLRDTITSLGPFFIKLGQALSIRPDILSPKAMVELQQLCDKVPSYPSADAFGIVCQELGVQSIGDVFSAITPEPVAAASLGQVYKATLRDGGDEVAVKVQRPFVLETVRVVARALRMRRCVAKRVNLVPRAGFNNQGCLVFYFYKTKHGVYPSRPEIVFALFCVSSQPHFFRPFCVPLSLKVSLDLHLVRELGLLVRNVPALSARLDLVGLLDEFAARFYAELDYVEECANGVRIAHEMKMFPTVQEGGTRRGCGREFLVIF